MIVLLCKQRNLGRCYQSQILLQVLLGLCENDNINEISQVSLSTARIAKAGELQIHHQTTQITLRSCTTLLNDVALQIFFKANS